MTLLPKHPLSRVIAALWLTACVALLIATLTQRELYTNERSSLAIMVLVYFLAFPSAHLAVLIGSKIKLALYMSSGFEPSILSECLSLWVLTVALGYAQWFIGLPWLSRKCWQLSRALSNGSSSRGSN